MEVIRLISFLAIKFSFLNFPLTLPFQSDIYFIGGFGTVAWIDVASYESATPDIIAKDGSEKTLKVFLSFD